MNPFIKTTLVAASLGALWVAACGGDEASTFPLDASNELLAGFAFDTGLQPPTVSPVRMSLSVAGEGNTSIHVDALAGDGPSLYQVGSGVVKIDGAFTLDGRLVVDGVPAIPEYDGDIPGLDDIRIAVTGEAPIAGFALDGTATVEAAIPPTDLPSIPLPGGIPGTLDLEIAAGSAITVALTGTCASVDGGTATWRATGVRSGTLAIAAGITIKVPVAGDKTFDVGTFSVPVPPSDLAFEATHAAGEPGEPEEGTAALSSKACDAASGVGGAGGTTASTTGTDASTATTTVATTVAATVTAAQSTSPASTSSGILECDFGNTCLGATLITSVEGDRPGPARVTEASGSRWFRIRLTEGDDSAVPNGFGYRALVSNAPPGTEFELSVRRGIDGEAEVPCDAAVLSDTGSTPEVEDTWPDILDHSNAVWLSIEVKIVAGDCDADYALLFWGGV